MIKNRTARQLRVIRHHLLTPPLTHGTARVEVRHQVTWLNPHGPALLLPLGNLMVKRARIARLNGKGREAPAPNHCSERVQEKVDPRKTPARGKEPMKGSRVLLPPLTHGIARVEGKHAGTLRRFLLSERHRLKAWATLDRKWAGHPFMGQRRR